MQKIKALSKSQTNIICTHNATIYALVVKMKTYRIQLDKKILLLSKKI